MSKSSTHSHALVQMDPFPQPKQPKYIPSPALLVPNAQASTSSLSASQSMSSSQNGRASSLLSGPTRAQEIMRRTLEEKLKEGGLTHSEMVECKALLAQSTSQGDFASPDASFVGLDRVLTFLSTLL